MRLKELRKEKKLTQSELAQKINIPLITYTKYELGNRTPTLETLIKLADFYNISIDYLIGRNFNNEFGYMTENERNIIYAYRSMSAELQVKASAMLIRLVAEN